MYSQRASNIPIMRYCGFGCVYCAFQKFQKISNCQKCKEGVNHSHLEVLNRKPPKNKDGEFLTVGLSGDVSFIAVADFWQVLNYCRGWGDRTFLIQSKNPEYFLQFNHYYCSKIYKSNIPAIPSNVILGTTIETDLFITTKDGVGLYEHDPPHAMRIISKAPSFRKRYDAMCKLNCRKAITIEPIKDDGTYRKATGSGNRCARKNYPKKLVGRMKFAKLTCNKCVEVLP